MFSLFFSPERIASAYELLGGTFLDEHHDSQKALQYWRAACDERERAGLSKQIQVKYQTICFQVSLIFASRDVYYLACGVYYFEWDVYYLACGV